MIMILIPIILGSIVVGFALAREYYTNEIAGGRLLRGAVRAAYQQGHRDGKAGRPDEVAVEDGKA